MNTLFFFYTIAMLIICVMTAVLAFAAWASLGRLWVPWGLSGSSGEAAMNTLFFFYTIAMLIICVMTAVLAFAAWASMDAFGYHGGCPAVLERPQ